MTIDVGAEYDAHIDGYCGRLDGSWTKTLKTWALPTHCLEYDEQSHALVVAAVPSGALASAAAAASSDVASLGSAVSRAADGGLSPGSIAGICVGAVAGVALLAAGGFFLLQRRRRMRAVASEREAPPEYEVTRVEEQYEDDHEGKPHNYLEVRSIRVPSPTSSFFEGR